MKKKLLSVLLASAMVMSLVACGSKEAAPAETPAEETTTEEAEAPAEEAAPAEEEEAITATITVWGPSEDQSADNGNWLPTMCEQFAALHPNWTLTFEYGVCAEGDAKATVTQDVENAADVYMLANDNISDLVAANAIAEIGGSYLDGIKAANTEAMVSTVTYNDAVYAFPFTPNTWFMYYDKSVYSEDDVKSLDTMLEKGKVSFPLSNSWYIEAFYLANGATIFGDGANVDANAGINFGGDNAVAVTNYLVDLVANPNFINDADGAGMAGLRDGSVNAIFSGSWDWNNVEEALGENIGVAALPTVNIDGTEGQMKSFCGSKAIGVNPNAEYPEVAMALAAYLAGTEAQQAHYDMRNIIPSDQSISVEGNELAEAVADTAVRTSVVQPLVSNMGLYWSPAENMGKNIVAGTVTHDNAAELTEEMNTAMNTDVAAQ